MADDKAWNAWNAWHGEQVLKEEIVSDLRDDLEQERFNQGGYLESHEGDREFVGCHIGCLMMAKTRYKMRRNKPGEPLLRLNTIATVLADEAASWHENLPAELGIPTAVGHFWDKMFESLPAELAPRFAVESLECIEAGADLSTVLPELIVWMITDPHDGFLRTTIYPLSDREHEIRAHAEQVAQVWRDRAADRTINPSTGLPGKVAGRLYAETPLYADGGDGPFARLTHALRYATAGAPTGHAAAEVACSYAESVELGALTIVGHLAVDPFEPFEDEDAFPAVGEGERALWLVAKKFFALCASAPSQGPAQ